MKKARRVCLCLLLAACMPRVGMPPLPSADAPVTERERFLTELSPAAQVARGVPLELTPETYPCLLLRNRTRVCHPLDLAPLVAFDSVTAASAARFDDLDSYGTVWWLGGAGLVLVGAVLMMVGGSLWPRGPAGGGQALFITGASAFTIGGVGGIIGGVWFRSATDRARREAFDHFASDLAIALGL